MNNRIGRDEISGITCVIALASYNEFENLQELLRSLVPLLDKKTAIVIADDSANDIYQSIHMYVEALSKESSVPILISHSHSKGGRGAAIRRAFNLATEKYSQLVHLLEADSDGSHRAMDIAKVAYFEEQYDLLIGSRYQRESEIVGWTISRRIMSWTLNKSVPRILGINCADVTNGLRRYSKSAVDLLLSKPQLNTGFIYLSEVAKLISDSKMTISETPIRFEERIHGSSTVSRKEISDSLRGILTLIRNR